LADYSANLASQLDTVGALRKQYIDVQAEIIASKTLELHQTAEVASLKDFIQRCDLLMAKIKDLLDDAPGYSATDMKPTSIASGDLTQQFLTFMQQSENRYHTSEMQHHENMENLVNALKDVPLGATSGSALPVTAVKPPQLHLPTFHASALVNTVSTDPYRCCRKSSHPYHKCQGWHNVLLHDKSSSVDQCIFSQASASSDNASDVQGSTSPTDSSAIVAVCSASEIHHSYPPPRVFLATALVNLLTATGQMLSCRILLDCGAQVNVIASDMASQPNLPRPPACFSVSGQRATTSRARFFVNATVVSRTNGIRITLKCFVMPQIPGMFPNWPVDSSKMHIPQHIPLADPDWAVQRPVDILISGNHFWDCFLNDSISLGPGLPMLTASVVGHVVVGENEVMSASYCLTFTATTPETSLHQFREFEDVPVNSLQLEDQLASPSHSASAHQCIGGENLLPLLLFHHPPCILGESREFVIPQLRALERKFHNNFALQMLHCKALDDLQCVQWVKPLCDDSKRGPIQCVHHHRALIHLIRIMLQKSLQENCIQSQPESSGSTWLTHSFLPDIQSTIAHCFRILTQRKYQVQNIMPVSGFRNASHCISCVHQPRILERAAENIAQPGSIQPRNWKWLNTLPFPLDPRTLSYQEGHMLHQDNHPIVLPKLNRLKFIIWQEHFRQLQPIYCMRKENLPHYTDILQLPEDDFLCSYRSEDRMDPTGENVGDAGAYFDTQPKIDAVN
uniref:Uncharacterized protein n=1 Tax=Lutzomyia longipalpis TaxID=7200 RepID=A0A1B0CJH0_LUTLO